MAYPEDLLLLLTHIPKCVGTSFRTALVEPCFNESDFLCPKGIREVRRYEKDFRFLIGHYPFGVHRYLNPRSPAAQRRILFVTALREPVDQMISYFFYHRNLEEKTDEANGLYQGDVVGFYQRQRRFRNMQTRFLAGVPWALGRSPLHVLGQRVPALMLAAAKRNLRAFHYVFKQASADVDFAQYAQDFDLSYQPHRAELTVTKGRPAVQELADEQRERMRAFNAADVALLEHLDRVRPNGPKLRDLGARSLP